MYPWMGKRFVLFFSAPHIHNKAQQKRIKIVQIDDFIAKHHNAKRCALYVLPKI